MKINIRIYTCLVSLICLFTVPASAQIKKVIKVGITEYQNIESVYDKYNSLFQEMSATAVNESVSFELAVGTPDEVFDWYNRKLIDVAILTTQPVAALLSEKNIKVENLDKAYIGNLANKLPSESLISLFNDALETRRQNSEDELFFYYRTGLFISTQDKDLIVPDKNKDLTFNDIQALVKAGKMKFLFVRPYSISGYILPKYYLHKKDILIEPSDKDGTKLKNDHEFTYSHPASLRRLLSPKNEDKNYYLAAFVQDDLNLSNVLPNQTIDKSKLYKVRGMEEIDTEEMLIPQQVVLVNFNMESEKALDPKCETEPLKECNKFTEDKELMLKLFRQNKFSAKSKFKFKENPEHWREPFSRVQEWLKDANLPKNILAKSTFDEFIEDLTKSKKNIPRLALVLSGGGAKCAYQIGAITAIEERLKEWNNSHPNNKPLKIDLVVGTSGGAINTLLTSLMLTADKDSINELKEVWATFKKDDFFKPPFEVRFLFGLSFGIFQALLITFFVIVFGQQKILWKHIIVLSMVVLVVELVFAIYQIWSIGTFLLMLFGQLIILIAFASFIRLCRRIIIFLSTEFLNVSSLNWWRLAGWIMLALSTLEICIAYIDLSVSFPEFLENSKLFQSIWLIVELSSLLTAPFPFFVGVIMILSGWKLIPPIQFHERWVIRWLSLGLIVASIFLLLHTFAGVESVTSSAGIDKKLAERIPDIIINHLNRKLNSSPENEKAPIQKAINDIEEAKKEAEIDKRLKRISEAVISNNLLERDMVITTSRLPIESNEESKNSVDVATNMNIDLPQDLYFYSKANVDTLDPSDKRFVFLGNNQDKLLDVVIGSSTIYPLFPSRKLENIKIGNKSSMTELMQPINVIDGGFIHNSPVDAADRWGATHILLIEASPKAKPFSPKSFFDNIFVAYQYLFLQAQQMDTLSRGSLEILELRPTSECDNQIINRPCSKHSKTPNPDMNTFDFTSNLLGAAFDKGKNDVCENRKNDTCDENPLFVRVPGFPVFRGLSITEQSKPADKK